MKTSTTSRHSATSRFAASRKVRGLAIACALFGAAIVAQSAMANCPPGYAPKAPGVCVPTPPHRYHPGHTLTAHSNVPSSVPLTHTTHKSIQINKEVDWHKVKPQPGVPIEHHSSASEKHGIIFVGGHSRYVDDTRAINSQPVPPGHEKQALNPQPIPPGHSALNTQPIPPGHSLRRLPHPGVPLEKNGH